jgi:branched-chain amino acid transport system permease protein
MKKFRASLRRGAVPLVLLVVLILIPKIGVHIPLLFQSDLNSPGTLQLLALMLVFAGLAFTYDVLFGFTGLLSFGHALYFAVGVYVAGIAMTKWHWGFWPSILFTAWVGLVLPLLTGAVSLRVGGIAFAMVTLAFAQAGSVLAFKNPGQLTGGEDGFGVDYTKLPADFVGIFNTKNLYWLALGYLVAVFVIGRWAIASSPGHVWQAIRENELRVEVLGLRPYMFKLMSFVLASFLATMGGIVYLIVISGVSPAVTTPNFTLALLVMVVIGGAGSAWGAMIGGLLYTYLNQRLADLSGSHAVTQLPKFLRVPLEQPLFVLGVVFICVVYFAPGGIARLHRIRRRPAALEEAL